MPNRRVNCDDIQSVESACRRGAVASLGGDWRGGCSTSLLVVGVDGDRDGGDSSS